MFNLIYHKYDGTKNATVVAKGVSIEDAAALIIEDYDANEDFSMLAMGYLDLIYPETGEVVFGFVIYPMNDFIWDTVENIHAYCGEYPEYTNRLVAPEQLAC